MIGRTLGHYCVVARIGAGGMGEVYRARDEQLDREVALKLLPTEALVDPIARARQLREARTAAALNHPNICTVFEVGEAAGQPFIAMEYVEGRPLSACIPADGLPAETAVRYGIEMAAALAHAHDRGILHRDLKSSNVVVTTDGHAKILDFGLAKKLSHDEIDEATRSELSLTKMGDLVGTLQYLAPEVLHGQPAHPRSDIWALGVVLYEMAAGAKPFSGKTSFEITSGILRESPQPLPDRIPTGLQSVVFGCLAKEPAQRYQRAGEVRAALEALRSSARRSPGSWIATSRVRFILLAGAILMALAGGYVVWDNFFLPHARQPRAERAKSAAPPGVTPRLSTGAKPSANREANEYFEKAQLFLPVRFDLARGARCWKKRSSSTHTLPRRGRLTRSRMSSLSKVADRTTARCSTRRRRNPGAPCRTTRTQPALTQPSVSSISNRAGKSPRGRSF